MESFPRPVPTSAAAALNPIWPVSICSTTRLLNSTSNFRRIFPIGVELPGPQVGAGALVTRGRKLELIAKTDDCSTRAEFGVKMTSAVGNLENHPLALLTLSKSMDYACRW